MDNVYVKAIKNNLIIPKFRLSLLYPDESVKEEVVSDIVSDNGNLSINYQQGIRRSLNLTLINIDKKWLPSPNSGNLWVNSKFSFELGVEIDGIDYWKPQGIFIVSDPNAINSDSEKKLSIQLQDKFAFLTNPSGNVDLTYEIPADITVREAVEGLLNTSMGNGQVLDTKSIILDPYFDENNKKIGMTIVKSPDTTIGDIIIEIANAFASDVYYNEVGNLVIERPIQDYESEYISSAMFKPSIWSFSDQTKEYINSEITYKFNDIINCVTVVAANIIDSSISYFTAQNNNPYSPISIPIIGFRRLNIDDSIIRSQTEAEQKANFELLKRTIIQNTISITCTYIPHLDVNCVVDLTDSYFEFNGERFLIQSVEIPISINCTISISATNIKSLPFTNIV